MYKRQVDYYLRRKISYYAVKRALAPVKLIMRCDKGELVVWGLNDSNTCAEAEGELGYVSFDGSIRKLRTAAFKPVSYTHLACSVGKVQEQGMGLLAKRGRISLFGGLPGESKGCLLYTSRLCKEANYNCIRIWGGAVYPDDEPVSYTHLDVYKRQM